MLPFLYLCAMPDSVLLHMRFILRKRNITVLRDSFSRYYGRHLRVSFNDGLYRRVRQGELPVRAREGALGYDLGAPCKSSAPLLNNAYRTK